MSTKKNVQTRKECRNTGLSGCLFFLYYSPIMACGQLFLQKKLNFPLPKPLSQIPRSRAYLNLFHPYPYIVVDELLGLESGDMGSSSDHQSVPNYVTSGKSCPSFGFFCGKVELYLLFAIPQSF